MPNKRLLIVAHVPSTNTHAMAQSALRGAQHPDTGNVEVIHIPPLEAVATDVLQCDAILLGTTENFGYMSGAMKDFFDRIYYPCLEHTEALPFALYIRAGLDGTGTQTAVTKITSGLKWKSVQATLLCRGEFQPAFLDQAETLGMSMAAGLDAGIF